MSKGSDKNVGSIEEDIKRCEQLIKPEHANWIGISNQLAIEHILQDYTRQKQINEEHQEINGELREKVKELEIDLTTVYIKGVEDGKDKYEQKIKDEIEVLRKMLKATMEGIPQEYTPGEIIIKRNTLEELLQESEEK